MEDDVAFWLGFHGVRALAGVVIGVFHYVPRDIYNDRVVSIASSTLGRYSPLQRQSIRMPDGSQNIVITMLYAKQDHLVSPQHHRARMIQAETSYTLRPLHPRHQPWHIGQQKNTSCQQDCRISICKYTLSSKLNPYIQHFKPSTTNGRQLTAT